MVWFVCRISALMFLFHTPCGPRSTQLFSCAVINSKFSNRVGYCLFDFLNFAKLVLHWILCSRKSRIHSSSASVIFFSAFMRTSCFLDYKSVVFSEWAPCYKKFISLLWFEETTVCHRWRKSLRNQLIKKNRNSLINCVCVSTTKHQLKARFADLPTNKDTPRGQTHPWYLKGKEKTTDVKVLRR